jgi:hypothetical protein
VQREIVAEHPSAEMRRLAWLAILRFRGCAMDGAARRPPRRRSSIFGPGC